MKIGEVNELLDGVFVDVFKNVVELYPRAAQSVVLQRPFKSLNELIDAFNNYLEALKTAEKGAQKEKLMWFSILNIVFFLFLVAILQSHPDLAGKLLFENKLSVDSANEQAAAGLNKLTDEQKNELVKLNAEYSEKFGFPFVICVRQNNKIERILEGLHQRLPNSREDEITNGINHVKKICQLRIENIVELDWWRFWYEIITSQ